MLGPHVDMRSNIELSRAIAASKLATLQAVRAPAGVPRYLVPKAVPLCITQHTSCTICPSALLCDLLLMFL
jgi:hypothetical protein